jgi:asparagine synthase (glutamine-hydrolysing)
MKLILSKIEWHNSNNTWVTGFIRAGDRYLTGDELLKYFSESNTLFKFKNTLKTANGQFSVIIRSSDEIWAATDRLRNYPLFYSFHEGQFIISDDCYRLATSQHTRKFNSDAVESFLLTGSVIHNLTLLQDIFQVEAGKYVRIADSVTGDFYDDKITEAISDTDINPAGNVLNNLIHDVFRNHLEALSNKFLAIPLSGGFDSRLIAAMCKEYHPENLICYTYGTRNNPELILAEKAADRLGLKWFNIVYDSDLIKGYFHDDYFQDYYPYVSNLTSMFFMQEYFAVKYLKENNLIPENCVFIPGFSGDMVAGSHLIPAMKKQLDKGHIARMIYDNYFVLIHRDKKEKSHIVKLISDNIPSGRYETWKIIEAWDMRERQAKFIVNSAKVYSFFGFDYVLPFWDNQFIDFFSTLPFPMKLNKRLYDHVLKDGIFKELNLNLNNEINPLPSEKYFQRFKEGIKSLLPSEIKNKFIQQKSPILYDEITRIMIDDMGNKNIIPPMQSNYYNSYIIQWYLLITRVSLNISEMID